MAVDAKTLVNIPIDREVSERATGTARIIFLLYSTISLWAATEFAAWGLHFDKFLKRDALMPYLYMPWALITPWTFGPIPFMEDSPSLITTHYRSPAFAQHIYLIMAIAWAIFLTGLFFTTRFALRKRKKLIANAPRTHDFDGSAHWANREEVGRTGLLPPTHPASLIGYKVNKSINPRGTPELEPIDIWKRKPGIYVGEYIDPETGKRSWLTDKSNRHGFLAAPTRGGKGVGIIVPACLTWSESLFVNDPKGELFEITSWYRKHKMGQLVFKFDPSCTDGTGCRINPLDFVRVGTEYEVQDAQGIALNICDPQGLGLDTGSESDHWRKTAYAFLTGVVLHVLYCREIPKQKKTLTGIDEFLSNPNKSQKTIFTEMLNYEHDPEGKRAWIDGNGNLTKTCSNVAMAARNMLDKPDGERGSVMSSVQSYFDLYRDPIVAKNISASDFSPEDLMYNDKAVTLYMVNLPKHMERIRPLMRLITSIVMQTFTGALDFENSRPKDKYQHPMLMLMDEFTSTLSKMSVFANSISFVAGYGIKILIVVQDLVQLADVYGDKGAQALTSNVHTQIVYATNNPDTAKQYSQMLGNATIRTETRSWSKGKGGKTSRSESFRGRPLLEASEIQAMHETDEIVMVTGYAPIRCKKIVYHKEQAFMSRVHPALKRSDSIPEKDQCYYKALEVFHKEALVAAEERRREYGVTTSSDSALAAVALAEPPKNAVEKSVQKKLFGQINPADLDDDEEEGVKELKDMLDL